jgi:lipid-A-disaccharide synthase-like uncharacterized protein
MTDAPFIVTLLGVIGGILFFGRFYVQWIVSEFRKESVIPMAFWYMSIAGSVLLFPYAFARVSPGGTLGLCFNMVVYARNLVHRWREQGILTRRKSIAIHTLAGVLVTVGTVLTIVTWKRDHSVNPEFWVWSGIWAAGQGLVALRFLCQWMVTEINRKSIVPRAFWYLSLSAAVFHSVYFFHRGDTILTVGTLVDVFVYCRNLALSKPKASPSPDKAS